MSKVRRARSGATRTAILDACIAELSDKGYADTSMDAIAAKAGVSKMSVYYHFESKDALCVEALTSVIQEHRRELLATVSGIEGSKNALQVAVKMVWNHFMSMGRSFYTLLSELQRINPSLLSTIEREISAYSRINRELIADGQERGEIIGGHPTLLTQLFINAVGSTVQWYDPEGSVTPDQFVKMLQATIPRMLLKSPDL